jgi:Leucine-rich repeat (LRR) protein
MKKLKNLSTLVLRNNPIHTLTYFKPPNEIDLVPPKIKTEDDYDEDDVGISTASNDPSISNVFRLEVFPNLYELSLSFCQLSGELEPFPSLPLRNLEISMGLKSATTLTSEIFQSLTQLEWLALDHNSLQTIGYVQAFVLFI